MATFSGNKQVSRKLGIITHSFPDFTRTERFFFYAFLLCFLFAALIASNIRTEGQVNILLFCGCVMSSVLGYWVRQEPDAFFQLVFFPFSGHMPQWPRPVLSGVRVLGIMMFTCSLLAFPFDMLPVTYRSVGILPLFVIDIAISVVALRKRKGRARVIAV